jgi:hypothetical protein
MATFWSDARLEPKRKYRFRLLIDSDQSFVVTKVKNPSVKISETPHKFLNHTFYYPGRAEWDPVDISFVDPAGGQGNDQSRNLYAKLLKSGYASPLVAGDGMSGFTKYAATEKGVGNVKIEQLGPENKNATTLSAIAHWTLYNAFFTNISWGDYDYNGEEMLECSTTIRYDYAVFQNEGAQPFPE